jgi:hypothetical protein
MFGLTSVSARHSKQCRITKARFPERLICCGEIKWLSLLMSSLQAFALKSFLHSYFKGFVFHECERTLFAACGFYHKRS